MSTLTIDFGHGGKDAGAVNTKFGITEANVVLGLKSRLMERAHNAGISLHFTRSSDYYLTLSQRSSLANTKRSDLFYSIHCNAFNGIATGIECFSYKYSSRSAVAAKVAQKELVKRFPSHNNRGAKKANFSVLRKTNMRAVLWELEFIDSDFGAQTLTSDDKLDLYADAIIMAATITLGIKDYKQPSKLKRAIGGVCSCFCREDH